MPRNRRGRGFAQDGMRRHAARIGTGWVKCEAGAECSTGRRSRAGQMRGPAAGDRDGPAAGRHVGGGGP